MRMKVQEQIQYHNCAVCNKPENGPGKEHENFMLENGWVCSYQSKDNIIKWMCPVCVERKERKKTSRV